MTQASSCRHSRSNDRGGEGGATPADGRYNNNKYNGNDDDNDYDNKSNEKWIPVAARYRGCRRGRGGLTSRAL